MIYRTWFYLITNITLIWLGVMFLVSCQTPENVVKTQKAKIKTPPDVVYNMNLNYMDSGRVTTHVEAAKVVLLQEDGHTKSRFDKGIEVKFYAPDGTVKNSLKGDFAIWDNTDSIARIERNVEVLNEAGDTLFTSILYWDQIEEQIFTPKMVHIVSPTKDVWGRGMVADQNFKKYRLGSISGRIRMNQEEETKQDSLQSNSIP